VNQNNERRIIKYKEKMMKEIKDNYVLKKDYEELLEKLCDLE